MSTARASAGRMPAKTPARPAPRANPVVRAPARTTPNGNAVARWSLALASAIARRPLPVLVTVAVFGIVGSVGWNATMRQTGKHPAPLFASKPAEVAKPAEITKPPESVRREPAPIPAPRPPAAASSAERAKSAGAGSDPIGTLIRTGDPARADTARIAAAQTALAKLYGPLKSDGVMGAGTKAAIERFERDRNLPVTGLLGARTVRALADQAGIAIE